MIRPRNLLSAAALAAWLVFPATGCSSAGREPTEVERLEAELREVEGKIAAQERIAGRAGMEPPPALMELYDRREALKVELETARAAAAGGR